MNNTSYTPIIKYWSDAQAVSTQDASVNVYKVSCVGHYPVSEFAIGKHYRSPWGRLVSAFLGVSNFVAEQGKLQEGDIMTCEGPNGEDTTVGIASADHCGPDDGTLKIDMYNPPGFKLVVLSRSEL